MKKQVRLKKGLNVKLPYQNIRIKKDTPCTVMSYNTTTRRANIVVNIGTGDMVCQGVKAENLYIT